MAVLGFNVDMDNVPNGTYSTEVDITTTDGAVTPIVVKIIIK